ncbi:GntR family transcriptional regulator [Leucobacter iarius]|uniref:HTH gntR-type domain-containing protein n=1 Tax=Leucobacter iarius TaxID=333963 RepID=A0ABN2L9A6_9MICO
MREHLRREIVTGALAPGSDLSEGRVAELYGYPAASIRTALQALEHEGLVIVRPRVGTTVHPVTAERTAHALHALRSLIVTAVRLAHRATDAHGSPEASPLPGFLAPYAAVIERSGNAYLQRFAAQLVAHLQQAAAALGTSGLQHPSGASFADAAGRADLRAMLHHLDTHFDHAHRVFAAAFAAAARGAGS